MTDEKRQEYALMRYGIIAPAVNQTLPDGMSLQRYWEEASDREYTTLTLFTRITAYSTYAPHALTAAE